MSKLKLPHLVSTACLGLAVGFSNITLAEAPGGPDCGWGNLMFEGDTGPVAHIGASLFNGSSGNAWIGMLFGTNGCTTEGTITYGGKSLFALKGFMDEVAQDIALGDGEALDALAVVMGIEEKDKPDFKSLLHTNFETIFPHENVDANQVISSIQSLMQADQRFSHYVS